jgi:hypothetical protein
MRCRRNVAVVVPRPKHHRLAVLDHDPDRRAAARRYSDNAVLSIAADHTVSNRHVDAAGAACAVRRDPECVAIDSLMSNYLAQK